MMERDDGAGPAAPTPRRWSTGPTPAATSSRRSGTSARSRPSACPFEQAQWRKVRTLSGGEQKRLVLEALLRGPDEVLLLDEPDNYLDVPGQALAGGRS